MLKLHHYEHNDNYFSLKPIPPTRGENLHIKHGSKKICALNSYQQGTNSLEYMGVLTESNVVGEQSH
jgi:hypothetical protein